MEVVDRRPNLLRPGCHDFPRYCGPAKSRREVLRQSSSRLGEPRFAAPTVGDEPLGQLGHFEVELAHHMPHRSNRATGVQQFRPESVGYPTSDSPATSAE